MGRFTERDPTTAGAPDCTSSPNHQIDLVDADQAVGVVRARVHRFCGVLDRDPAMYLDGYVKRGGCWCFSTCVPTEFQRMSHQRPSSEATTRSPLDGRCTSASPDGGKL
jgi:hypothetical protein